MILEPCPWCKSLKVMAEGYKRRVAMVCQKCLARGPEVDLRDGREVAIKLWNNQANSGSAVRRWFKSFVMATHCRLERFCSLQLAARCSRSTFHGKRRPVKLPDWMFKTASRLEWWLRKKL